MSAIRRISVSTTIPGYEVGLRSFIQQFLKDLDIGFEVERVLGEHGQIQSVKLQLKSALQKRFPQLQITSEWTAQHSTEAQPQSKIHHPSSPGVKSCGEISKMEFVDDVAPNDSASALGARFLSLLEHSGHILQKTERTIITATYNDTSESRTADFDITTCISWDAFMKKVDRSPDLAIPIHARRIYCLPPDGHPVYVSELGALQSGIEYVVETDLDKPTVNTKGDLEGFYGKLKSDQDLDDQDIQIIKTAFDAEIVKFKQLIGTGELAMTDNDLKEIGIARLGLRKAILAVIQNLKN